MNQQKKTFSKTAGVLVAALFVFNGYLLYRVNTVQVDAEAQRASLEAEVDVLRESMALREGAAQRELSEMREKVGTVSRQAAVRAGSEAKRYSDRVAKTIAQKQREQQELLLGELSEVEKKTQAAESRVVGVEGEVDSVKGDVAAARESLDATAGLLSDTRGNVEQLGAALGDHEKAIEILKLNGERHLLGFNLTKSKTRMKVGDIQLRLRNTDAKRHRYSIEILADDRNMVKKEKHVNEPVSFYVTGTAKPYELVITSVRKDRVVGYLARPKSAVLQGNSRS